MNSWINTSRAAQTINLLDETFEKIEIVDGLKTSLFPHQKTVIKAMLDLERTKEITISTISSNLKVYTNAGVLSEAVGSGKTIDLLSLILLNKPSREPDFSYISLFSPDREYISHESMIRKTFSNILNPTIVFAGVSVVNQWLNAIKTFTNLKAYAVLDVKHLQKLLDMIESRQINQYDIIIVKNGKITRPVKFPQGVTIEFKNTNTINYIYNVITNMRSYCWTRCIVDDMDTIHLPHNAGIINSLFTWYVSATTKIMKNSNITNRQFKITADFLLHSDYSCSNVLKNTILFYNLNIRNKEAFVSATNNISYPKFFAYVYSNPNNMYIGLLSTINSDEAREITEMLNGDAIDTAADRLGIKTNRVADIFESMLGDKYTKYKKSISVLTYIEEIEPLQGNRASMNENPDENDTYTKKDLINGREIKYNYPNLKSIIENTKAEYMEIKRESSFAIERVKTNIKAGECPICIGDLVDDDIVIAKCCGTIICGLCCFGTIFNKNNTRGQCSNCRAILNYTNLIYLNSEFDLSKIVEEVFEEPEPEPEEKKEINIARNKNMAIIDIIKGIKPKEQICIDISINNLMKGTCALPDNKFNKVLIFANYEETLNSIIKDLKSAKIDYWKLSGSHSEINKTVELFTNCNNTCVLIINSTKHCAGLNLQTATDLIFAHKIIDPNVETQVIGRGQRLGRTSCLKIHYILYDNEYKSMKLSGLVREI
jgi:SNF2 family DNA or RNA helicase